MNSRLLAQRIGGQRDRQRGHANRVYTDDYDEQLYRPVEEIRKANLRGADPRGANVADTDFYLVDLRDAKFDAEQEAHFRRYGAILETRVWRGLR